jgi:hypothetical protein
VLDLPFTAVEWVLPTEMPTWNPSAENWMVWERSPLARERSLFGYWDDADDAQLAAAASGAPDGLEGLSFLGIVRLVHAERWK